MGEQIKKLKDHAHLPAVQIQIMACPGYVYPFKDHLPAGGCFQKIKTAEKGAFTGP